MTVRFPNHELGSRARVIVGGEELLGTLIGQWATGVRVEVDGMRKPPIGEPTDLGGGMVRYEDGTVAFVTLATDDHEANWAAAEADIAAHEAALSEAGGKATLRTVALSVGAILDPDADLTTAQLWEAIATRVMRAEEAGRLAAIRADVALFVRQTDEVAIDAQERAAVLSQQARVFYATRHLKRPHEAREPSIPTMQRMHVLDYRSARICVDQAADCRRWLEATR